MVEILSSIAVRDKNPSGGNNIIQDANDIIWGTNHGGNNPTYNEEGGED